MTKDLIKSNLRVLDTFRGLAALYVLFGHARWLLWEGYAEGYQLHPEAYSWFDKGCMYAFGLFRYGHQAVIFFFVLSGFVIHYSTSRQIDKAERFDIPKYLFKRVKRLYPPLIAAICILLVLEWWGKRLQFPIYFGATPYALINQLIRGNADWKTVLGNFTFLQGVYTPVLGTDGPLWSLMYEWWFYILYIPVILCFRKSKTWTCVAVFVLWIVNSRWNLPPLLFTMVFKYFLSWFTGMLLADHLLYQKDKALLFIFLGLEFCAAAIFYHTDFGQDTLLAVPITVLFYFVLTTRFFSPMQRLGGGGFSYTLYVIHFPMLCFLSGYVMKTHDGRLPAHFQFVIAGILLAVAVAWLLHFIVEKPFISGPIKSLSPAQGHLETKTV